MAQALRQAGENEFYSLVEYAEMYHWHVENVRIIRETDTQFVIIGEFLPAPYAHVYFVPACRAIVSSSGNINVCWGELTTYYSKPRDEYGYLLPGNSYSTDEFSYDPACIDAIRNDIVNAGWIDD